MQKLRKWEEATAKRSVVVDGKKREYNTSGPRDWIDKNPLKRPGPNQRVTLHAVVPSTWDSKHKPSRTKVVKSVGYVEIITSGGRKLFKRNPDELLKPNVSVMVLFHGHGGGGSIVRLGDKWYSVVAQRALYKNQLIMVEHFDQATGKKVKTARKHPENTGESKFALIRIKRPEGASAFDELVAGKLGD